MRVARREADSSLARHLLQKQRHGKSRFAEMTGIRTQTRASRVRTAFFVPLFPMRVARREADSSVARHLLQKQRHGISRAFAFGADDGNRTRVFGLGSGRSAIELHLHSPTLTIIVYFPPIVKCFPRFFNSFPARFSGGDFFDRKCVSRSVLPQWEFLPLRPSLSGCRTY